MEYGITFNSMISIPKEQIEAARIDGAGNIQVLIKIILPGMKFIIFLVLILSTIGNLQHFDIIWVMTRGGPVRATTTVSIEVYRTAFQSWNLSKAAGIGVLWVIIISIFAFFYLRNLYELPPLYSIPYRCLYSKDVDNLRLTGRLISGTRIALGSYRVQKTLATTGQAIGVAAHLASKYSINSREVGQKYIFELQQILLREDATILSVKNQDRSDLARTSKVSATSETKGGEASNVINGINRQYSSDITNMWISNPVCKLPQILYIDFGKIKNISSVLFTFDTALHRAREENVDIRAFKETASNYSIQYNNNDKWVGLIHIEDNYHRRRVHSFKTIETDKIRIII